jgi:hypothetical protein
MKRFLLAAAFAASLPAMALALTPGDTLGTTADEIRASLTELGWEVRKIEMDDGKIEAYAVMGTQMLEIYVDPTTGKIVKVSVDD